MNFRKYLPGKLGKKDLSIPVVRLSGAIAASSGPLNRTLSLSGVGPLLEKAKKVLVFVEDVAASGGYMLAIAGDEIFVDETSIVGSIGVVSASFGFDKAIEKLGVERRVYTAGKNKVSLDPFQPEKKEDIAYIKELQLEIHKVFIDMVEARRGAKLSDDPDIFTGKFWTGIQGKELGLVDGFGHIGTIIKQRYGKDAKLKLMTQKRGLLGRGGTPGISFGSEAATSLVDISIMTAEEKALRACHNLSQLAS